MSDMLIGVLVLAITVSWPFLGAWLWWALGDNTGEDSTYADTTQHPA